MPYGVTSASDVCQMYISQILDGITSITNSQDDILVWADNDKQLEERTIEVFDATRANGMKLNPSKCRFHLSELFLGHNITSKGILPDDSNIKAIINMEYPTNVTELQRFLGLINYVGKFIPNLSTRTESVRNLLKTDTVWTFDANHKKDLDDLKQLITKAPVLKVFVEKLPTRISCDASSTGLGAVLEQMHGENWYPVAYAGRSLTDCEKNYCQLEKETLSILFAWGASI